MTPDTGDTLPVLPFQVETYLEDILDTIVHQMRQKEQKLPEERIYWHTLELRCPRPKGMERDELIRCIEYHLSRLLEVHGFGKVYINGVTHAKTYHIRWHSGAPTVQEVA